jgi:hypothetical protein
MCGAAEAVEEPRAVAAGLGVIANDLMVTDLPEIWRRPRSWASTSEAAPWVSSAAITRAKLDRANNLRCVIAADDVIDARPATAGVQGEAQVESTG